jgi:hypothetical protein
VHPGRLDDGRALTRRSAGVFAAASASSAPHAYLMVSADTSCSTFPVFGAICMRARHGCRGPARAAAALRGLILSVDLAGPVSPGDAVVLIPPVQPKDG